MAFDNIFSVFRISSSGMSAQRRALDAAASNIANIETTRTEEGGPYRPQRVRFSRAGNGPFNETLRTAFEQMDLIREAQAHYRHGETMDAEQGEYYGYGVEAEVIQQEQDAVKMIYDPAHPDADANGYVAKPNISMVKEMTGMMIASRLYEANISVLESAKGMIRKALDI